MSNLINQNNQSITPSGWWYINHTGTLSWTQDLSYNSENYQQLIISDITSNHYNYSQINTLIAVGNQANVEFTNPSNDDYVTCLNTRLLNDTMSLDNLNFNQAFNETGDYGNYLSIQKATAITTGGQASYWIANVFNNSITHMI